MSNDLKQIVGIKYSEYQNYTREDFYDDLAKIQKNIFDKNKFHDTLVENNSKLMRLYLCCTDSAIQETCKALMPEIRFRQHYMG